MPAVVKAAKWGNSIALRLPAHMADRYNITVGTEITLEERSNTITLSPRQRPRLKDLVAKITPHNRVPEVKYGKPVGKEVW